MRHKNMNKLMNELRNHGVSPWLDHIQRDLLEKTLKTYIDDLSVTGLTSNPSIFDQAISHSDLYDQPIIKKFKAGLSIEDTFFELAIEDLRQAADLFTHVHQNTNGLDGWVSLEVSPLLAHDTASTIAAAQMLFKQANRKNLYIKIPGTLEGIPAIEEAIFAGIPVNITLLFSAEQYEAAAEAYLRGIERRIEANLSANISSVASLFISRWDKATMGKVSEDMQNTLGLAVANQTYASYRTFLASSRVQRLMNYGVRPQRLLWASTGTKDEKASDVLYVENLILPYTINTMPEKTLLAFANHGKTDSKSNMHALETEQTFEQFEEKGIAIQALATQLQNEGADAFVKAWHDLLSAIENKRKKLNL